jgi:hypothetical protein
MARSVPRKWCENSRHIEIFNNEESEESSTQLTSTILVDPVDLVLWNHHTRSVHLIPQAYQELVSTILEAETTM